MPLDQTLVGSVVTGALAIASQCVAKLRCYTSCKRGEDGEYCEPQFFCGFMDSTLIEMAGAQSAPQGHAESESSD